MGVLRATSCYYLFFRFDCCVYSNYGYPVFGGPSNGTRPCSEEYNLWAGILSLSIGISCVFVSDHEGKMDETRLENLFLLDEHAAKKRPLPVTITLRAIYEKSPKELRQLLVEGSEKEH